MSARLAVLVGVVTATATVARAHAVAGEWCVAASGGALVTESRAASARAAGIGYRAGARLGYGLANFIELGAFASTSRVADLRFPDASLDGRRGTLFADTWDLALAAEVRLVPGLSLGGAFARTSPVVALRAGAAAILRTAQDLRTADGLTLATPDDDLRVAPFFGAVIGAQHRFGDHLLVGVELAATVTTDARTLSLDVEAAWTWY